MKRKIAALTFILLSILFIVNLKSTDVAAETCTIEVQGITIPVPCD
ncbi:MAG: hypothetical protein QM489_03945 [Candidatus Izemoplasma sp.]